MAVGAGTVSTSSLAVSAKSRSLQLLTAGEERLISIGIAALIPTLIWLRVFEFTSWPQVDLFWAYRLPPEAIVHHPHYYRYLVVYPGFLLTDTGLDIAFSLYVALFMLTGQYLMRAMVLPSSRVMAIGAQCVYISAHFFMNGRGAIAWAAWVLAIYAINDGELRGWRIRHGIMTALATLGAAVSSGALIVVYVTTIAVSINCLLVPGKRLGALFMFPGIAYFLNYSLVSVDKNVAFYQEGNTVAIINMLNHGWGALVEQSWIFIMIAVVGLIILPFIVYYFGSRYPFSRLAILLVPLGGGAFGFTTLTLVVPSVLVALLDLRGQRAVRA